MRTGGVEWTIVRPSLVFGDGECFLRLFARLLRLFPVMPLAGADTRYQPVDVRDAARCIVYALGEPEAAGQVYPLCGPTVYNYAHIGNALMVCPHEEVALTEDGKTAILTGGYTFAEGGWDGITRIDLETGAVESTRLDGMPLGIARIN